MNTFFQFLSEQKLIIKKDDLHVEDHLLHHGKEGFETSKNILHKVHNHFSKGNVDDHEISKQGDSKNKITFGYDERGKFVVGNSNGITFSSNVEISKSYSGKTGEKLKLALMYMKKVTPKGKMYEGEIMHSGDGLQKDKKQLHFTPDKTTHSIDKDSIEGKKAKKSKIGIMVKGDTKEFFNSPYVHLMRSKLDFNGTYTPFQQNVFNMNMRNSQSHVNNVDFKKIEGHEKYLADYVEGSLKNNMQPNTGAYKRFLSSKSSDTQPNYKSDKFKNEKEIHFKDLIKNVNKNQKSFDSLLNSHTNLLLAKTQLLNAFATHKETMSLSQLGKPINPQGFKYKDDKNGAKFTHRHTIEKKAK